MQLDQSETKKCNMKNVARVKHGKKAYRNSLTMGAAVGC